MSIAGRRARHALGWGLATGLLLTVMPIVPQAAQAAGSITASRDANAVTSALTMTSGVVTSAAFDAIPPSGNPAAVSTQPLTAFPSDSSSYAILSTGDATQEPVGRPGVVGLQQRPSERRTSGLDLRLDVPQGGGCFFDCG